MVGYIWNPAFFCRIWGSKVCEVFVLTENSWFLSKMLVITSTPSTDVKDCWFTCILADTGVTFLKKLSLKTEKWCHFCWVWIFKNFIDVIIIIFLIYNIGFAIHQHASATGVPVSPILNPRPTSLPILSLWVIPMHQIQASLSCIKPGLAICFLYDIIHVLMPFSQIIPCPSLTESKRLFYTSVSLLLSCIQCCHYHLSKFHIYALGYYIGVFLSGLLHSV